MAGENSKPSSAAIASGLRRGDADAVREVRERVQRISAFRGYGIPEEERQDIVQQVMAQLWRVLNAGESDERVGFWGLVDIVTTRRCIDWLRSRRPSTSLENVRDLSAPEMDPREAALEREKRALAAKALARLEPGCQELIRLRTTEEMSYAEIAERLGKNETALRAQMYRCVKRVQQFLSQSESA